MEQVEKLPTSKVNGKGSKNGDKPERRVVASSGRQKSQGGPATAEQMTIELGTPKEEMEKSLRALLAEANNPATTPTQKVQLLNGARATIKDLARLKEGAPIHEHPDFEGLVEDLVMAVADALGPSAPEGIELAIADSFLERQTARAQGRGRTQ